MQTIIIGHKNPDMDSICSALGYARLKQLLGVPDVVAARAGSTNARIDFVLEKFGVEAPVFLTDLSPRVSDVMERDAVSVRADSAVYDAIQLIGERQLRGLPVTDENNRCVGLLSAFKLSHLLFPSREEAASARRVVASLVNIVETFGGEVVTGTLSAETTEQLLMVGAMNPDTFSQRLQRQRAEEIVLFVGDREDIQMRAIESNVRAIVVTGGLAVRPGIKRAASESQVARSVPRTTPPPRCCWRAVRCARIAWWNPSPVSARTRRSKWRGNTRPLPRRLSSPSSDRTACWWAFCPRAISSSRCRAS